MTRKNLITGLITTTLLATGSAFAAFGGSSNQDIYGYVVNGLDKPVFVGTGLSMASPRIDAYNGLTSRNGDIDQSGFAVGSAGPEKSYGPWGHGNPDAYGTVLPE